MRHYCSWSLLGLGGLALQEHHKRVLRDFLKTLQTSPDGVRPRVPSRFRGFLPEQRACQQPYASAPKGPFAVDSAVRQEKHELRLVSVKYRLLPCHVGPKELIYLSSLFWGEHCPSLLGCLSAVHVEPSGCKMLALRSRAVHAKATYPCTAWNTS